MLAGTAITAGAGAPAAAAHDLPPATTTAAAAASAAPGVVPSPRPRPPGASPAPAAEVAAVLAELKRRRPDLNIAGVVLTDLGRRLSRGALDLAPAAGGFVVGFLLAQGLSTEAGFNRIFAFPAEPFNPRGEDHRGNGAALIGWTLAIGIAGSIVLSGVGMAASVAARRLWGPAGRTPPSPVADLLLADAGRLWRPGRRLVIPAAIGGLIGFVCPQCIATHAAFNFLDNIEARPFNRIGGINRTLASALLGWGLAMSLLTLVGGVAVGLAAGVGIGGARRALAGGRA